ncbi:MAG: response regulator [Planctomycetes bacterium]|nr:response regulator [Planctomycetota bacterium]
MNGKVMLVDDEQGVLNALERLLRRDKYEIIKAGGGREAIELMKLHSDIALIISDMRMPDVDGAKVMEEAYKLTPDSIRIALTGYADSDTIMNCINHGQVRQFFLKPWNDDELRTMVKENVTIYNISKENKKLEEQIYEQNMQLQSMNEELEKKVAIRTEALVKAREAIRDSMKSVLSLLTGMMEMHAPGTRGHCRRVADLSLRLAKALNLGEDQLWEIEAAALVHDIGKIALPSYLNGKSMHDMSAEEREEYKKHPAIGRDLLAEIPGFENIADLICNHHESVSGNGFPTGAKGDSIPLGGRIMAVADSFDRYCHPTGGGILMAKSKAFKFLEMAAGNKLDPDLVALFLKADIPSYTDEGAHEVEMGINHLVPGMILSKDITNIIGKSLVKKNTTLTLDIIDQIANNPGFDPTVSRIFILKDSIPQESTSDAEDTDSPATKKKSGDEAQRNLVVVVDDEQHVLNALRRELRSGGYDVETFTNPIDAIQQIRMEKNVYALITDFNMPAVRGDRFIGQVQKEFPNIPCIVITGLATKDTVVLLRKSVKVARMLPKPWDKELLLKTLADFGSNQTKEQGNTQATV